MSLMGCQAVQGRRTAKSGHSDPCLQSLLMHLPIGLSSVSIQKIFAQRHYTILRRCELTNASSILVVDAPYRPA